MCMDCAQTLLVRCPRATTVLAGWAVRAATTTDGARHLLSDRAVWRRARHEAGKMRWDAKMPAQVEVRQKTRR
jgi:hypothetical protein